MSIFYGYHSVESQGFLRMPQWDYLDTLYGDVEMGDCAIE